jgi:hypothetical protein
VRRLRLVRDIVGHEVKTARQMGWTTVKNGELLALAAKEFDVFVTVDRNLGAQQNLSALSIAVLTSEIPFNSRARSSTSALMNVRVRLFFDLVRISLNRWVFPVPGPATTIFLCDGEFRMASVCFFRSALASS